MNSCRPASACNSCQWLSIDGRSALQPRLTLKGRAHLHLPFRVPPLVVR
jgi:hypothetical protein